MLPEVPVGIVISSPCTWGTTVNAAGTVLPTSSAGEPPERDGAPWWRPDRSWTPTVVAAVVAIVVFVFARATLIDDAYITLAYARNLAFHLHWGLVAAATANTATSVFNVLVLALFAAITRHVVLSLGIVYVLSSIALEYGLRRVARVVGLPKWFGIAATVLVAVNPLLMSSIGLEVQLSAGLIGLLLAASVERRAVWFGVLSGLLILTRPDLLVVVLPVFLFRTGWWRGWWRSVLAAAVVTVPWYLWSWIKLGSVIPDTLLIKTGQAGWPHAGHVYAFGLGPFLYLRIYPIATVLSFLPAILGVLALAVWTVLRLVRPGDRVRRLGTLAPIGYAGVLYYAAYAKLAVPPYHWYYGAAIVCLTVFLVGAIAVGRGRAEEAPATQSTWQRRFALAGVAVLALACVGHYVGHGLPRRFAPITSNWASPAQYAEIGRYVGGMAHGRIVRASGEIGGEAFFCDCTMVDEFSDRADVVTLLRSLTAKSGPAKRKLLDWNFHFLNRTQRALVPQLILSYTSSTPPKSALAFWPVDSPWFPGPGHHYIVLLNTGH